MSRNHVIKNEFFSSNLNKFVTSILANIIIIKFVTSILTNIIIIKFVTSTLANIIIIKFVTSILANIIIIKFALVNKSYRILQHAFKLFNN